MGNTSYYNLNVYLSAQTQDELINIIAYDVLQRDQIDEVKKAKFFTILADKVESSHVKQLPICVRFVDKWNDIREEFKEFGRSTQVNGKARFNELLRIIKKADLEIINLCSKTEIVICLLKW